MVNEMVDLYCERLDAGLWAETIGAITKLSFVLAALAIWRQADHLDTLSSRIWLLIGLMLPLALVANPSTP
jgi:hypothetical protein